LEVYRAKTQRVATFFFGRFLKSFLCVTLAPLRLSGEIPKTEFSICSSLFVSNCLMPFDPLSPVIANVQGDADGKGSQE
jgi:hypothetical protein